MGMKYLKLFLVLASIAFVLVAPNAFAATEKTDQVNITVTVAQKTLIDVTPTSLTWSNVDPGTEAGADDDAYGAVQIENIGSTNISAVWFNNTYPASRPFGTGDNASYDAGNFVVIQRRTTGDYMFPNRLEFNASSEIIYISTETGWYYGRFRNASHEYFWAVDATSECNDSQTFRIGLTEHNQTQTGSVDFTNGGSGTRYNQYTLATAANNNEWGYAAINVSSSDWQMCVAVKNTCDQAFFYRWNTDAPGGTECAYAQNFTSSTLTPGEWVLANITVRVPYGVHYGNTGSTQGQLTVIALSEYSA